MAPILFQQSHVIYKLHSYLWMLFFSGWATVHCPTQALKNEGKIKNMKIHRHQLAPHHCCGKITENDNAQLSVKSKFLLRHQLPQLLHSIWLVFKLIVLCVKLDTFTTFICFKGQEVRPKVFCLVKFLFS